MGLVFNPNKNKIIYIIVALFLIANFLIVLNYKIVWWDSAVYIGMGKYIFSGGSSGMWEESRPLVLPSLLGIGWALGFDAVDFGRAVSIVFSVLVILSVYIIGARLSSVRVGILAAFFTSFSYTFLFFSPNILTEIPSTFFILLAFYFFIEGRFLLMGLFSGIAVMTRFFQVFALLGLLAAFIARFGNKPGFYKKLLSILAGASILIFPYILLNYYLYGDALLPFKIQNALNKTTGWMHYYGYGFYFTGLLKENFLAAILLFLPFFLKKKYKFFALLLVPLAYLAVFSFVRHKEMRFILIALPFIYLLLSYTLVQIYARLSHKKLALGAFSVAVILWLSISFASLKEAAYKKYDSEEVIHLQNYLKSEKGEIGVTSPLYALYSNEKISGLYHYPSHKFLSKFSADTVLYNTCDMLCPPRGLNPLCEDEREALSNTLSKFRKIYEKEANSCTYRILIR